MKSAFFFVKALYTKALLLGLVLCLLVVSAFMLREVQRKKSIQTEISNLEQELVQLDQETRRLEGVLEYLKTDAYVEREAKKRLGLQLPGEQVVLITEDRQDVSIGAKHAVASQSNWEKWWSLFFK